MGDDIVIEGRWDCSNCGKIEIGGLTKECPRCGEPQNSVLTPSEQWYFPKGSPVVTDSEQIRTSELRAWNCGHCGVLNDGDLTVCRGCDRPLDHDDTVNRQTIYDDQVEHHDVKPDPRDEILENTLAEAERVITGELEEPRRMSDLTLNEKEFPTEGADTAFYRRIRDDADERFRERERFDQMSPLKRRLRSSRPLLIGGGAVLVVLLIAGLIAGIVHSVRASTATVAGNVTITELHWERKVKVEKYTTLTDSAWDYPGDARVVKKISKIRTYRTVHDGWRSEDYTAYETHYRTETYTDQETRYKTESYTGSETRYKDESYSYDCSYQRNNGNGTSTKVSRSCTGTKRTPYTVPVRKSRQVAYTVPIQKTRQVPYQVPVQRTRRVEVTHQEPVYAEWYTYQVDRWTPERWASMSDATSTSLLWPGSNGLLQNSVPGDQVGEERLGNERSESYAIVYADAQGKVHTERSDASGLWSKLARDESVPATYRKKSGDLVSVDWNAVS